MMRTRTLLIPWLCLAAACAGLQRQPSVSEAEQREYGQALSTVVDDPALSERRLAAFLERWPKSALADDALMRMAEIALARGEDDTALTRFETVVREHPRGDRVDAARVEVARIELKRGDREAARSVLSRMRISRLSSAERTAAYQVLADAADEPAERLRWLARVRAGQPDEKRAALVDSEIDALIARMEVRDLYRAYDEIGDQPPAARVLLKAAELDLDAGEISRARKALERVARLPLDPRYLSRRRVMEERLQLRAAGPIDVGEIATFAEALRRGPPDTSGAVGTLGVVLPLSGPFAQFGEESLHGIMLAAGVFGENAGGQRRVRVLVRDSAGRPERAAEAVRELASHPDVRAIIGPLLSAECEAAAAVAEDAGVPLLALTAREEVSRLRPHVFRVRTMPAEEVATLVDHAMDELDARRFAILYPRDAYGRGLRSLFWEAVEQRGGNVVAVASYDPEATDFAGPIRKLVGYTLLDDGQKAALRERRKIEKKARRLPPQKAAELREEARALRGPGDQPLPPIVDFDVLFIPESHDKVVLIAPQLAFHEATGARLLGANGWYDPELLEIARDHVDGAHFTAHFYLDSPVSVVRDFAEGFEQAYASAPDAFAAQGYDAANLVLVQLARGRDSREEVRAGVLDVRDFPGVTGVTTMRSDGSARKRPFLLAVERGHIVPIE